MAHFARYRIMAAGAVVAALFAASPPPAADAALEGLRCDFDDDGYADLAVGSPGESIGRSDDAGAVNVLYGTDGGLAADRNQLWHQGSPGIPGAAAEAENTQFFGWDLACGDFDGDGSSDLAISVPWENLTIRGELQIDAGAVNVIYGSADGLTAAGAQLWHQASPGIANTPEPKDRLGRSVAAGDFDGDGFDDLAIGVAQEDLAGVRQSGLVHMLFGSADGLTGTDADVFGMGETADWGGREANLGMRLVAGDFDADGHDDLVMGETSLNSALRVARGSESGLDPATSMVLGDPDEYAGLGQIGFWGTVGDVDGDGYADYIAGAGHYVYVWPGSADGLQSGTGYGLDRTSPGMPPGLRSESGFGRGVSSGDIDADGYDDVVVGVDGLNLNGIRDPGAIVVLFGSIDGLTAAGSELWHQDSPGVPGRAERDDRMTQASHLDDFDGDGHADAAIGVHGEDLTTAGTRKVDAGAVNVLPGTPDGLTGTGSWLWHQARPGIAGRVEANDRFGQTLGS